ncbi:galactokinase family protein [Kocuria sp. APC 4018]|uniref:galactokinase n=1 Tax=Kocuria sp. APC 4018 TaxID=3035196 RepID=UPI0025B3970B|nr:galactokinase family protein [Kocuria sp. APC 4018]MDN3462899.1 galactokinase family protein [Kocuria sp. APC 4018]
MSCEPAVVAPPEEAGCPQWVPQPDVLARAELLSERFERAYGRAPVGVWAAPGRANLMGEYIDYSGGMCLPFAHQYVTLTAAAPRTDGVLRALSLQDADESVADHRLRTTSVADIAPGAIGGWFGYAAGVAWGMQRVASGHSDHPVAVPELALAPDFGADLMVDSTVPIGAGLASSAALECSVALALFSLSTGDDAPDDRLRRALARACMDAENHIVGANTGGLDQTASLRSHAGETLALDCRDFDAAVSACLDAGALGAKVVGGGFGGSVIALAREDELDELAASVCSAFSDHGFRDPLFLTLNPSPAGQRVR